MIKLKHKQKVNMKKTVEIRVTVNKDIKRKFEGAYKYLGLSYGDALEKAMELFVKANIVKLDTSKLMEGTI